MATKFLTNIDLNQNQLIKTSFQQLADDPNSNLFEGWVYYNTTSDTLRIYANGAWRTFLDGITTGGSSSAALTINESGGIVTVTPNLATSSTAGVMSASDKSKLDDATSEATASKLVIRDGSGNIKVAGPTDDAHAATKAYVDAARSGLDVKASVRAATVSALTLSGAIVAGNTIDGVTLATGDRVLVKAQDTPSENGIYVALAEAGTPVRATDADSSAEVTTGMFTFVSEGTVNADSGWVLTTNDTITLGTTGLTFAQFSGAGQITAGDGLTKTGNTINAVGVADRITVNPDSIDIASTYAGQSSIVTLGTITTGTWGSGATDIAVASGGTGASTAADARTNLGFTTTAGQTSSTAVLARVVHQACNASSVGVSTTSITHNFGTKNLTVQVYQVSTGETVNCDVVRSTNDIVIVTMNGTISADDFHIVVTG